MQLVYVHNINNTKCVFLVADNTYFLYSAMKSAKHGLFFIFKGILTRFLLHDTLLF